MIASLHLQAVHDDIVDVDHDDDDLLKAVHDGSFEEDFGDSGLSAIQVSSTSSSVS